MPLKALLDEAKNSLAVLKHNLLLSNGADALHCFFEGQTDESFYGPHIRAHLRPNQKYQSHCCGNKDAVYNAFAELQARIKHPTIGLFFVDKDLDDLIPKPRATSANIYVTSTYSIENCLADVRVIERTLGEIFRIGSGNEACEFLCRTYEAQLEQCAKFLLHLMAWVLHHRRAGSGMNLKNIKLGDLCSVREDLGFESIGFAAAIGQLDRWCQVSTPTDYLSKHHAALLKELAAHPIHSVLRGKFVLWFVVAFLSAVKSHLADHEPRRVINTEISTKSAMDVLGPRCAPPECLNTFLSSHLAPG